MVVVSGHRGFDYDELLTAKLALDRGAALVRDQPRPDAADARAASCPGTGAVLAAVETASGQARRDRRQARAPPLRAGAWRRSRGAAGWRWSATGSPPTSRAAAGPGWTTSSSSAATTTRADAEAAEPAPDHVLDDLAGLLRERRGRAPAERRRPAGVAFAGIFAVTFCGLLAVGAVLPVLPRYVHGPLDGGNVAVGIVIGSYAITGLLLRPFAGRFADRRGRKPTVLRRRAAGRGLAASSTCCRSASPG